MDSIEDAMYQVVGVIMFCMALSIFFLMNRNTKDLIAHTRNNINGHEGVYEQRIETITENVEVGHKEVIAALMGELQDTIVVNYSVFDKNKFSYLEFDHSTITRGTYVRSYRYNEDGSINQVIYKLK